MAFAKKSDEPKVFVLEKLEDLVLEIHIKGLTPVIPHKWSEKAKSMMPGHPDSFGKVKEKKGVREPEVEAEACVYRLPDGSPGIPATAFKAAIVGACRFFKEPSMKICKQLIFVEGVGPDQLVAIEGTPRLREDTPRNSNGSADLRYRYQFEEWTAVLRIRFVPTSISAESVMALVDAAGRGGVGDWRPSSPESDTGTFGTWRLDAEFHGSHVEVCVEAEEDKGKSKKGGRK